MASTLARVQRARPSLRAFTQSLASTSALAHRPIHRHAMMSALHDRPSSSKSQVDISRAVPHSNASLGQTAPVVVPSQIKATNAKNMDANAESPQVAARPPPAPKAERARPTIRATKAAITLTAIAVERLRALSRGPTPQLIRIGVRNKGCAGLSYHLEYVEKSGKFDEVVEQDGVKVLIDSKALFSIIGSEMDWKEDALSAKFAFKNPNIKDACGCGESFTVGS